MAKAAAMTNAEICQIVHNWTQRLELHTFPFDSDSIPWNGVYILFETGEHGHGDDRIVRVGTHTGDDQLPSRLTQHFMNENKDRSIFRKNIGRCLLNQANDPYLDVWNMDMTTRAKKEKHGHLVDAGKEKAIEKEISSRIQTDFAFVAFEIENKNTRLLIESRLIATVARCDECGPSQDWFGNSSPIAKIRQSGLWQVQELDGQSFSTDELRALGWT